MSNDQKSKEEVYNAEIAPVLEQLRSICQIHGMDFVAFVEHDKTVRPTYAHPGNMSLSMRMIRMCAKARTNLDDFVLDFLDYADENGISLSESVVAKKLSVPG